MSNKVVSVIFTIACIVMVGGTGVIVLLSNLGNKDFDWTVGIAALVVITLIPTIIAAISTGLFKSSDK